jgi:uncharacterized protein (DUF2267 family)
MQHDEFIGQVQHRARLSSCGDAEVATRAKLETLAERLAGNEPLEAASQLPRGIAAYLEYEYAGARAPFYLNEFFQRVSLGEGAGMTLAVYHTRVVMEVFG